MPMNPVRSLMNDPEKGPDPNGMAGKMDMVREAEKALHPAPAMPEKPATPAKPSPVDKVSPKGGYGTGKGEKRPSDLDIPGLPKLHKGGEVMQSGPHNLKKGEHVLTGDQKSKIHHALGLAADALSHGEPDADDMPQMPKHLREMHIKELHTGGFHITKHSGRPGDESTTHGAPDNDSVVGHFMDHMGHPDEGEEEAEMGFHGMGK